MTTSIFNLCGFGKDLYCISKGNSSVPLCCSRNSPMTFFQRQDCSILFLSSYILESYMVEMQNIVHVGICRLSKCLAIRFMCQCSDTEESQSHHFPSGAAGKTMETAQKPLAASSRQFLSHHFFAFNYRRIGQLVRTLKSSLCSLLID